MDSGLHHSTSQELAAHQKSIAFPEEKYYLCRMFSEHDIQKGLRVAIWEGCFATVHITLTTGAFLTGFALMLGVNDFQVALLTAIPLLTQVLQIFSVHVIERVGRRKLISGVFSLFGRTLWALVVLLPFLVQRKSQSVGIFLVIFTIISMAMSFSGAPWLSWMADLVPAKIRGRYFGQRNMILGIITMATSILAGRILDHYKSLNQLPIGFLIVELFAVFCAIIAFGFLLRQPEPPYQRTPSYSFLNMLKQPFQTEKFKKLLTFYLFYIFAVGLAIGYFPVYLLKTLRWSFSTIALLSIGTSLVSLVAQPLWGVLMDRVGHKPVIKITALGLIPVPILYLIATPDHSFPIWLDICFTGVFWSGFNLVMFNMVFHTLPQHGRLGFLAVNSALVGVTNFIAMIFGGWLAQHFASFQFHFLGQIW
ncbi:MAG: MFS transporter, partial [candidate division KSB1 bacterium]|nr:MFS transporter [candidate division KSB1 bacterium]